ncbi:MAG TPA: hypothetical protein VI933_03050 [archaeon]|nr:hypothetical protein [archaeon]
MKQNENSRLSAKKFPIPLISFLAGILFIAISSAGFSSYQSPNYSGEFSSGYFDSPKNSNYSLQIRTGDSLTGVAANSNYTLSLGSIYSFSEDLAPQFSNISQSSSTPKEGGQVILSAYFSDDKGLAGAIISTNESGTFVNESIQISGLEKQTDYVWNKQTKAGTTVTWKFFVSDSAGNYNATPEISFFVGATDLNPPQILSTEIYPTQPSAGEQAGFMADVSDDFGLASAVLELNGKNVSTVNLAGKKLIAEFRVIPEGSAGDKLSWKIFIRDSTGKEVVSEAKTFTLLTAPPKTSGSGECKESEKPKPLPIECTGGMRKAFDVSCDAITGKWVVTGRNVICTPEEEQKQKSANYVLIIVVIIILAVIGGAGYHIYIKNKKVEKDKKEEKSENAESEEIESGA